MSAWRLGLVEIVQFRCDEPATGETGKLSGDPGQLSVYIGITVPDHATEDDLSRLMERVCERTLTNFRSLRRGKPGGF